MMNPVIVARELAMRAHGDQMYGDMPYLYHLEQVEEIVYNHDPSNTEGRVLALLHDTLEDTDLTRENLLSYGVTEFLVECVELLTDETADSRRERKRLTNEKLSKVAGDHTLALLVKTADRLANVRNSEPNSRHFKMYQREHRAFKEAVYRKGLCDDLWEELDSLLK